MGLRSARSIQIGSRKIEGMHAIGRIGFLKQILPSHLRNTQNSPASSSKDNKSEMTASVGRHFLAFWFYEVFCENELSDVLNSDRVDEFSLSVEVKILWQWVMMFFSRFLE